MRKFFYYILFFAAVPVSSLLSKDFIYFRAQCPEYILQNNAFEVSVISAKKNGNIRSLDFYLITDGKAYLSKAELRLITKTIPLSFEEAPLDGISGYAYKMRIDFADASFYDSDYFQLVFALKAGESGRMRIDFKMDYRGEEEIIRSYTSLDNLESEYKKLEPLSLICYKPQSIAGGALLVGNEASVKIALKKNGKLKNLLLEFWAKFDKADIRFMKAFDKNDKEEIFALYKNSFQMLEVENTAIEPRLLNNSFIGSGSWNHFQLFFSGERSMAEIYSNGDLIYSVNIKELGRLDNLQFEFFNVSQGAIFNMDLVNVWRIDDSGASFSQSGVYINSIPNNSSLLAEFPFDNERRLKSGYENEYAAAWINKVNYVKSDAPIFSRAPEINAALTGGKFSIGWKGNESEQASMYVLERSFDGENYSEIYSAFAGADIQKYSYTDFPGRGTDVAFYRLKQINKDKSWAYSSQVKIGAGSAESFRLSQNFPNPFNPSTKITIDILEDSYFELTVYDLVGKKIARLFKGQILKGKHDFEFDGSELPSGVYFYEAKTSASSEIRKMILSK